MRKYCYDGCPLLRRDTERTNSLFLSSLPLSPSLYLSHTHSPGVPQTQPPVVSSRHEQLPVGGVRGHSRRPEWPVGEAEHRHCHCCCCCASSSTPSCVGYLHTLPQDSTAQHNTAARMVRTAHGKTKDKRHLEEINKRLHTIE